METGWVTVTGDDGDVPGRDRARGPCPGLSRVWMQGRNLGLGLAVVAMGCVGVGDGIHDHDLGRALGRGLGRHDGPSVVSAAAMVTSMGWMHAFCDVDWVSAGWIDRVDHCGQRIGSAGHQWHFSRYLCQLLP